MCDLTNPSHTADNRSAWQADDEDGEDLAEREQLAREDHEAELWDMQLHAEAMRELGAED